MTRWDPAGFPDRIAFSTGGGREGDVTRLDFGATSIADLRARYGARLHINPLSHTQLVFLNVEIPPFDDVRVRRALNYAVDRGRAADLLGSRKAHVPTCQVLPPGFPGYTPACRFTVNPNPAGTWSGPDLARLAASSLRREPAACGSSSGTDRSATGISGRCCAGSATARACTPYPICISSARPRRGRQEGGRRWGCGAGSRSRRRPPRSSRRWSPAAAS